MQKWLSRSHPPRWSTLFVVHIVASCASISVEKPASTVNPPEAETVDEAPGELEQTPVVVAAPSTWGSAREQFEFRCPSPAFELAEERSVERGGTTVVIQGDHARHLDAQTGPLRIGVLGALKDASPETRENVQRAARRFAKERVTLVVANGDLGEDRELIDVFTMLDEEMPVPTLVHSGNMEWTSAFTRALAEAEDQGAALLNGNWISHLELRGGVHLLVLPGYHDLRFLKPGGCRYVDDDIERIQNLARTLSARGDTVVVVSHGPPRQQGHQGLDLTLDDGGHVGDPRLTTLLEAGDVAVGIFSHILESGGRATGDPTGELPLKLPMKRTVPRLFVNAGSASAYPWQLLDGRTSVGMAMIVEVAKEGARAEVFPLR
ncbi:MAG: metallophosphoesterase family protein [Myxococcota bacterium]